MCSVQQCSWWGGEVWSSECQSAGQTNRQAAASLGPGHLFTEVQGGEGAGLSSPGKSGLQTPGPSFLCGAGLWGLCPLSSACPCRPQATYVLLALAWVFVPIYISSEVSLLLEPWSSLPWVWALVLIGGGDGPDPLASLTSWQTLPAVYYAISIPISPARQPRDVSPGTLSAGLHLGVHTSVARGAPPSNLGLPVSRCVLCSSVPGAHKPHNWTAHLNGTPGCYT